MPALIKVKNQHSLGLTAPAPLNNAHPLVTRQMSLRDMVVTPESVPKFTIPPRCQSNHGSGGWHKASLGNTRRYTMPWFPHSSLPGRPLSHRGPLAELKLVEDLRSDVLTDPMTRAAMSLPHLTKITTPYGFVTLGESPCVRRRESMFFEDHLPHLYSSERENGLHFPKCLPVKSRGQSNSLSDIGKIQCSRRGTVRSRSCDAAVHFDCASDQPENCSQTSLSCPDSFHSTSLSSGSQRKGRLKILIKKRLAAMRALTPR